MTAVLTNPGRPRLHARARAAILPFLAGGALGAAATLGVMALDTADPHEPPAGLGEVAGTSGVLPASPANVEHRATLERLEQVDACTSTARAADTYERCLQG